MATWGSDTASAFYSTTNPLFHFGNVSSSHSKACSHGGLAGLLFRSRVQRLTSCQMPLTSSFIFICSMLTPAWTRPSRPLTNQNICFKKWKSQQHWSIVTCVSIGPATNCLKNPAWIITRQRNLTHNFSIMNQRVSHARLRLVPSCWVLLLEDGNASAGADHR